MNRGGEVEKETLHPELVKRLELVKTPTYEGDPLSKMDRVILIVVGLVLPIILMVWGW